MTASGELQQVDPSLERALVEAEVIESLPPIGIEAIPAAEASSVRAAVDLSDELVLEALLREDEIVFPLADTLARCGAYDGTREDFTISQCRDFAIVSPAETDEANELDNSSPAFGECVAAGSVERTSGFTVLPSDSAVSYAFAGDGVTFEVLDLANRRVAVLDGGTLGLNRFCDSAGGHLSREAGLVLIDPAIDQATVFPAPPSLQVGLTAGDAVEILAELPVDETRSHILLSAGRSLWSVDTERGLWRLLTVAGNPDFPYVFSDSGTRFFGVVDKQFQLIDLLVNPDGSLGFTATISPIFASITMQLTEEGSIDFATDEDIFLSHTSNTFRFPVPSAVAQ